jgi:hypothetical protein
LAGLAAAAAAILIAEAVVAAAGQWGDSHAFTSAHGDCEWLAAAAAATAAIVTVIAEAVVAAAGQGSGKIATNAPVHTDIVSGQVAAAGSTAWHSSSGSGSIATTWLGAAPS